ncbi:Transposase IS4 [Popillia japonica]|uniref:Transposase IS4 n=1 Tax=Popillia japonica TaxID=7064 RepID=A0AAW1L177_POPJA
MRRALSIRELEAILEDMSDVEDSETDAVYIPPPVDILTDEEDINDTLLIEQQNIEDIAGTFEIHSTKESEGSEEPSVVVTEPSTSRKGKAKQKTKQYVPCWSQTEPQYSSSPSSTEATRKEEISRLLGGKTPLEIFYLFFDEDILNLIVEFSIKYAKQNNRHDFTLSVAQLKQFIGILILTGYHTIPATDMYWSKDLDKGVDLVTKCMSRNMFRAIKRNLHLADNNALDKSDKFAKVKPVFDIMNKKYLQFDIFSYNLSIDEQMVPYFGRHSAKMYIKGKAVRFGFKIWCLCSSEGYLYQFIPYGGASPEGKKSEHPLGTKVVLDLLAVVLNPSQCRFRTTENEIAVLVAAWLRQAPLPLTREQGKFSKRGSHKRLFKDTQMARVIKEAIMTAYGKAESKPIDLGDVNIENAMKD